MGKYYPGGVRLVRPTLHLIRYLMDANNQWDHLNANYNNYDGGGLVLRLNDGFDVKL